jgi:hypothetical protein
LPENYVEDLYNNVGKQELYSPLSRDWYRENFNMADLNTVAMKTKDIDGN